MFDHRQRVLVDTNTVIEAHRTGCWAPIAGYFEIHTVETVIVETQTGYQNRDPEETINEAQLRASLKFVARIGDLARAQFHASHPGAALDPGELDLMIYAGTLAANEVWFLNSPDMASLRHGHERGWLDRIVSLEAMNRHLKARLKQTLRDNYTESWLSQRKTRLILG